MDRRRRDRYTTVFCSPEPGKSVMLVGYGEEKATQLLTLLPGDTITAVLEPMGIKGGYRVLEFAPNQVFRAPVPVETAAPEAA